MEKKPINCRNFDLSRVYTVNTSMKFNFLLIVFCGFAVKSSAAYYLFYLACKGKQDGCYLIPERDERTNAVTYGSRWHHPNTKMPHKLCQAGHVDRKYKKIF